MDRRQDPRSIVTPYAFAVHPDLVGRPLATPWQRLGAIVLDLLLIALLSSVVPGVLLAMGSAILLIWLATRKPGQDVLGKLFRIFVGCLGLTVMVVTLLVFLAIRYGDDLEDWGGRLAEPTVREAGAPEGSAAPQGEPGLGEVIQAVQAAAAFRDAGSLEEAQEIANRLARNGLELGLPRRDIRSSLEELIPEDASWAADAAGIVEEAMRSLPPPPVGESPEPDPSQPTLPTTTDPHPGAGAGDEPVAGPPQQAGMLPATITDSLAQDSIRSLERSLSLAQEARDAAETDAQSARQALEERENRGPLRWLYDLLDEVGLGFGWGALYLTITHAWWKGTSVGKRLFRIRVVMIDNRPPGWWLSFERAGGYAAGLATGLLGFAQVFWDPNRQAIHDKVAETVVIQDGKPPVPGPWIEEGRTLWGGRPTHTPET